MPDVLTTAALLAALPAGMWALLGCHELGHALPVLAAGGRAHVTIGSPDGRTVTAGRLSVTVGYDGLKRFFTYGTVHWDDVDSTFVRAVGILGGPLVSLTAIGALALALRRGADGLAFLVLANLLLGESLRAYHTIVPKTYSSGPYEGSPSDGKRFLQLIRQTG